MAARSSYDERKAKLLELIAANIPLVAEEMLLRWSNDQESLRHFLAELNTLAPAPVTEMEGYIFNRSWRYMVPPHNHTHVVITQRLDGPYAHLGKGEQCFYIGIEQHCGNGNWECIPGSSVGGPREWQHALHAAATLWDEWSGKKR